ncbi:hypothetical protein O3P69_009335 [Scylla paramamosain]|uniref:Uncharacterized protein n=1 Tax=Scylla paramamosain TaxID=85552 RepID=A0AAW0TDA7_SCYPA
MSSRKNAEWANEGQRTMVVMWVLKEARPWNILTPETNAGDEPHSSVIIDFERPVELALHVVFGEEVQGAPLMAYTLGRTPQGVHPRSHLSGHTLQGATLQGTPLWARTPTREPAPSNILKQQSRGGNRGRAAEQRGTTEGEPVWDVGAATSEHSYFPQGSSMKPYSQRGGATPDNRTRSESQTSPVDETPPETDKRLRYPPRTTNSRDRRKQQLERRHRQVGEEDGAEHSVVDARE